MIIGYLKRAEQRFARGIRSAKLPLWARWAVIAVFTSAAGLYSMHAGESMTLYYAATLFSLHLPTWLTVFGAAMGILTICGVLTRRILAIVSKAMELGKRYRVLP